MAGKKKATDDPKAQVRELSREVKALTRAVAKTQKDWDKNIEWAVSRVDRIKDQIAEALAELSEGTPPNLAAIVKVLTKAQEGCEELTS